MVLDVEFQDQEFTRTNKKSNFSNILNWFHFWYLLKFQFKMWKSVEKSEAIENYLKLKKSYRFVAGKSLVLNFNN